MSQQDGVSTSPLTEDGLIAELNQIEIPGELLNSAELKELSSQVRDRLDAAKSSADRLSRSLRKEGWERWWETLNGDQTKILQHALTEIHHLAQLEAKMVLIGLLLAKKHSQATQHLQAQQKLLVDQQDDLKTLQEAEAQINKQIYAVVTDLAGVKSRMESHREQMDAHSVEIQAHSERIAAFCQQMNEYVSAKLDGCERQATDFQQVLTADSAARAEEWQNLRDTIAINLKQGQKDRWLALILAGVALLVAVISLIFGMLR